MNLWHSSFTSIIQEKTQYKESTQKECSKRKKETVQWTRSDLHSNDQINSLIFWYAFLNIFQKASSIWLQDLVWLYFYKHTKVPYESYISFKYILNYYYINRIWCERCTPLALTFTYCRYKSIDTKPTTLQWHGMSEIISIVFH